MSEEYYNIIELNVLVMQNIIYFICGYSTMLIALALMVNLYNQKTITFLIISILILIGMGFFIFYFQYFYKFKKFIENEVY